MITSLALHALQHAGRYNSARLGIFCGLLSVAACADTSPQRSLGNAKPPADHGTRPGGVSTPMSQPTNPSFNGAAGGMAASDPNKLGVRIEDSGGITIEVVTLACMADCAKVRAVASGGNPPYAFQWDDGSKDQERRVCFEPNRRSTVSVTDTEVEAVEFGQAQQSATATITARTLDCPDPKKTVPFEDRHIFVTNRGGNSIFELDESLKLVRTLFADQGLNQPNGMAFTPDGAIWVADSGNNRILAFDATGKLVGMIDTLSRVGQGIESIAFDGEGTLYGSANPGSGRVARYSQDLQQLPDLAFGPEFMSLGNVNLTRDADVLVSDFSLALRGIRELDRKSGAVLKTFGTDLGLQEDVVVDGADRVFVSHFSGHEIVVYGSDRAELMRFKPPSTEPMQLLNPSGIALTRDCRLLVASWLNGRIYEWRHRGSQPPEYVRSVAIPGLSFAESISVSGLALPGGSSEFRDRVPTCDP